jgi:hypothetical protein
MVTLTIDLPDGVLSVLRLSHAQAEKDVRLAVAIEWYRRGAISQGRAAEIAGLGGRIHRRARSPQNRCHPGRLGGVEAGDQRESLGVE